MRAIGIPSFGVGIPHALGLFGPITPGDPRFWLGTALFLALAFALWQGNRWLLFEQQKRFDWLERPITKVVMLVLAVVLYTAPLTASTLLAWYAWAGLPPDVDAIRATTLTNVICVVFVTHAYETVLLVKARESDRVRVARLDAARLEAELAAFRAQVDPHFLFNCLNTLAHLVETDAPRAREMTERLADVYRYLLAHQRRALVSVEEERAFTEDYVFLLRLRFSDALSVQVRGEPAPGASIPPTALQLLVENAVKHNEVSERYPLSIDIDFTRGDQRARHRGRRREAEGADLERPMARLEAISLQRPEVRHRERAGERATRQHHRRAQRAQRGHRAHDDRARTGRHQPVRTALDRPLSELQSELPSKTFFRLNRQYLAHASAIRAYRPFFKGRLLVELVPAPGEDVVVSQENAARFRAWLDA